MITNTLNISKQSPTTKYSVVTADSRLHTLLTSSTGQLSEHQFMWPTAHVWNIPLAETRKSSDSKLGQRLASELERLVAPPAKMIYADLFQTGSSFCDRTTFSSSRPIERNLQELDIIPFLVTVRQFIDIEQLSAARKLLEAAPAHILSDPQVIRLRSILAPPIVKRVEKHEIDRHHEYKWLETESHKYAGRWVALDGGQLLAEAESLRGLRKQLQMTRHARPPLIHHVR